MLDLFHIFDALRICLTNKWETYNTRPSQYLLFIKIKNDIFIFCSRYICKTFKSFPVQSVYPLTMTTSDLDIELYLKR